MIGAHQGRFGDHFLQGKSIIAETGRNKLQGHLDFDIAIVHPKGEDIANGVLAQVIICKMS